MVGSLIEAHLFGSIKGNEECDYAHALISDYNIQGLDNKICSVGEDTSNMLKDVIIESGLV